MQAPPGVVLFQTRLLVLEEEARYCSTRGSEQHQVQWQQVLVPAAHRSAPQEESEERRCHQQEHSVDACQLIERRPWEEFEEVTADLVQE